MSRKSRFVPGAAIRPPQPCPPPRTLVLAGGGMKGTAYIGVVQALAERDLLRQLHIVRGASVGALFACMMALKYSPDEMAERMLSLNSEVLLDSSIFGETLTEAFCFAEHGALNSGEALRAWVQGLVRKKVGDAHLTMSELAELVDRPRLQVQATNLTRGCGVRLTAETHPDFPVVESIMASCALPPVWPPVALDAEAADELWVDGGLSNNFPLNPGPASTKDEVEQEVDWETIGCRFFSTGTYVDEHGRVHWPPLPTGTCLQKAQALVETAERELDAERTQKRGYWPRVCVIDVGDVDTTDFDLPLAERLALVRAGYTAMSKFCDDRGWLPSAAAHATE